MIISDLIAQYPELEGIQIIIPPYVEQYCTIKKFKIGTSILRKGDQIKYVYLLLEGIVNILNEFESGDCFYFAQTKALDTLGEIEFLAHKNTIAATCTADTNCSTLQIPLKILEKWISEDNNFLRFITTCLAIKNYEASYFRGMELIYPAIYLIKFYIIRHIEPFIKNKQFVSLEKSRQNISDELGICVRSVNRAIQKLKIEGLVSIKKGKLYITKTQYLAIHDSLEQSF